MSAVNRCSFVGIVAREPQVYGKVARVSLAVRRSNSRDGDPDVDFVPLLFLGESRVDFVQKYLKKGTWIAVASEYRTSQYEKDGEVRYSHEFVVDDVSFVGPKISGGQNSNTQTGSNRPAARSTSRSAAMEPTVANEEDIPF